jgi:Uma2 family endonuclease
MASVPEARVEAGPLPDHTQLPCEDGTFVKNSLEHLQSVLLTDAIRPVVQKLYPEGHYFIGQDCGIYWNQTDPPQEGAKAPDWFFVPDVPALVNGQVRRSYVLWRDLMPPMIVVEFVSGDGAEERDQTPWAGKFWLYEKIIRASFYVIYEPFVPRLEAYHVVDGAFRPLPPNARGHFEIAPLQVELGLWRGTIDNVEWTWLRCWSLEGELLPGGWEQAERERRQRLEAEQRADHERRQKEEAQRRAEVLAERLRALGVDPDAG